MKHFWIAFIMIWLLIALAGHGILTVWSRQIKVGQYEADTKRGEMLDYFCDRYDEDGITKGMVINGTLYKCEDFIKYYKPAKAGETRLL